MKEFDVHQYLRNNENEVETVEAGPNVLPIQGGPSPRGNLFAALMRQENVVGSTYSNRLRLFYKRHDQNIDFNWVDHIPQGYLEFAPRFAMATNQADIDDIRFGIDKENQDKALIGAHPIQSIFTGFIVNALDPTSLLPGASLYKGVKTNLTLARTALNVGSATFVQTLAQESLLRGTQYDRSLEESGMNLLASTFIGTAIGAGAGHFLNTPNGRVLNENVAKVLDDGQIAPEAKVGDTVKQITYQGFKEGESAYAAGEGKSAGAAYNPEHDPEGSLLVMPDVLRKGYGSTLGRLTPLTRGLTSPFSLVREMTSDILENNLFQKKNTADFGYQETQHALETMIKKDRLEGDKHMADYEDVFYEMNGYKKGELGRSVKHFISRNKTIGWEEFENGAWLAVVRNGSENPHFAKAGKIIRDKIFEPWKDRMIEIGELPPNVQVKTALGYFTRVYNIDKINDPRYFGSYEIDNPETIYTLAKRYVLRINDVLKRDKPFIDILTKDISVLKAKEQRIYGLKKELERLKSTEQADTELADFAYGKIVKEGQLQTQQRLKKLIDQQRLTEQEVLDLSEQLKEEFATLNTINQLADEKQLHQGDVDKLRTIENKLNDAIHRKETTLAKIEEQIEMAKASGKEKQVIELKERIKHVSLALEKTIKDLKTKLNNFSSTFSKEKMTTALNIISLDERIKAAQKIGEIEEKYKDKAISEKAAEFGRFLEEEGKKIYSKRERRQHLEDTIRKNPVDFYSKKIKELNQKLRNDYPPDLFNQDGNVYKILDTELEVKTVVEDLIDNIRSLNDQRFSNPLLRGITGAPDSTKNRHWLIPDEDIAPFLITSPSKVVPMYLRGVVSHYHITNWARENGFDPKGKLGNVGKSPDFMSKYDRGEGVPKEKQEQITKAEGIKNKFDRVLEQYKEMLREAVPDAEKKKLQEEFEPLLEAAKDPERPETWTPEYRAIHEKYTEALRQKADPKYAAYLTKRFNEAEQDITNSLAVLMGIYGQGENIVDNAASKFFKYMGAWNYMRMMGFMVVAAFTDPGGIVAKHGMGRFVSEGLAPVVKAMESAKHNKQLLKDMNRCMETYKGHRLKSFADQEGLTQETGLFGKAFHYSTQAFNNVSLMAYWTDLMTYIAGNVSISRTLRAIDNYQNGKIVDKEIQRVVNLGIPIRDFKAIHEQFKKHGGIEDESHYVNWAEWDTNTTEGLNSLNSFKYATLKDVDATIVIPSIGDKPLFGRSTLGSILFQFKSFAFASTNKILISGLQRKDAEFAQGAMSLLALGELSYVINRLLKNKEIETDPASLAYEALDRSGIAGILMEVPLTLQKVGVLPGAGTSRYNSRGWLGALGGPTLGSVEDITYLLNRFKNSDETPLTDKDSDKILKLMPGNNIFYLEGINRNLGLSKALSRAAGFEETE